MTKYRISLYMNEDRSSFKAREIVKIVPLQCSLSSSPFLSLSHSFSLTFPLLSLLLFPLKCLSLGYIYILEDDGRIISNSPCLVRSFILSHSKSNQWQSEYFYLCIPTGNQGSTCLPSSPTYSLDPPIIFPPLLIFCFIFVFYFILSFYRLAISPFYPFYHPTRKHLCSHQGEFESLLNPSRNWHFGLTCPGLVRCPQPTSAKSFKIGSVYT